MTYSIQIKASAERELRRTSESDRHRILEAIDALAKNPFTGAALKGNWEGLRLLRNAGWREIYTVENDTPTVRVIRIARRDHAYRQRRNKLSAL